MLDQLKKLVGHSAVYGFGVMSLKISPLILTPLFLHRFSRSQYGTMEVLNTFSGNLQVVMMLGIGSVLIKVYMNDCRDQREKRELMSSVLGFAAVLGIVLVIASYFARGFLASLLISNPTQGILVLLTAVSCAFILVDRLAVLAIRAKQWPGWYLVINFAHVIAVVGLNLYLVGYLRWGVYGTQLAAVLVAAFTVAMGLILIRTDLGLHFSWPRLRYVMTLSLPLIPVSLAPWVLNSSDRYFLTAMHGLDATGIYGVGYKFGHMTITMIVQAFQLAWSPLFFANANTPNGPQFCASVLKYYLTSLLAMALAVSVFAPELLRVLGKQQFWSAAAYVPWVSFAYVLYGLHFFTVPLFIQANKGTVLSALMIAIAGLNLALNFVLIKYYATAGAVAATVICFALLAVYSIVYANRAYAVPYPVADILKAAAVSFAVFFAYRTFLAHSWSTLLMKSTSAALFIVALYAVGYFNDKEKSVLRRIPGKIMGMMRLSQ